MPRLSGEKLGNGKRVPGYCKEGPERSNQDADDTGAPSTN
jgi:hypothetical protein